MANKIYQVKLTKAVEHVASGCQLYMRGKEMFSPKDSKQAAAAIVVGFSPFDINIVREAQIKKDEYFIIDDEICQAARGGKGMKIFASTMKSLEVPSLPYQFVREFTKYRPTKVEIDDFNAGYSIKLVSYTPIEVLNLLGSFANYAGVSYSDLETFIIQEVC